MIYKYFEIIGKIERSRLKLEFEKIDYEISGKNHPVLIFKGNNIELWVKPKDKQVKIYPNRLNARINSVCKELDDANTIELMKAKREIEKTLTDRAKIVKWIIINLKGFEIMKY